jgi:hypothetical protein
MSLAGPTFRRDEFMIGVRTLVALIALATIVGAVVRVMRLTARRARDLGAVSEAWIVQHRPDWHDSASR